MTFWIHACSRRMPSTLRYLKGQQEKKQGNPEWCWKKGKIYRQYSCSIWISAPFRLYCKKTKYPLWPEGTRLPTSPKYPMQHSRPVILTIGRSKNLTLTRIVYPILLSYNYPLKTRGYPPRGDRSAGRHEELCENERRYESQYFRIGPNSDAEGAKCRNSCNAKISF